MAEDVLLDRTHAKLRLLCNDFHRETKERVNRHTSCNDSGYTRRSEHQELLIALLLYSLQESSLASTRSASKEETGICISH